MDIVSEAISIYRWRMSLYRWNHRDSKRQIAEYTEKLDALFSKMTENELREFTECTS